MSIIAAERPAAFACATAACSAASGRVGDMGPIARRKVVAACGPGEFAYDAVMFCMKATAPAVKAASVVLLHEKSFVPLQKKGRVGKPAKAGAWG